MQFYIVKMWVEKSSGRFREAAGTCPYDWQLVYTTADEPAVLCLGVAGFGRTMEGFRGIDWLENGHRKARFVLNNSEEFFHNDETEQEEIRNDILC